MTASLPPPDPVDFASRLAEAEEQVRLLSARLGRDEPGRRDREHTAHHRRNEVLAAVVPVLMFQTDNTGRCTYVNDRWCQSTGLTVAGSLGEGWLDAVHADDRARIRSELEHALPTALPWRAEARLLRPDRSVMQGLSQAVPDFDEDKNFTGYIGTVTDITESHRAVEISEAFAELGSRLNEATTPRAAAEITLEIAGRLVGLDSGFLNLESLDRNQAIPVLILDRVDGKLAEIQPDQVFGAPTPMARRVAIEGAQLILRTPLNDAGQELILFGDTNRRSASLLFVPVRTRRRMVGVLSVQSYTPQAYGRKDLETMQGLADHVGGALERIEATEALRQSQEERFRDFVENTTDLVQSVAPDGRLQFVNRAWLDALGYRVEDLPRLGFFDIVHPDCRADCVALFDRVLRGETMGHIRTTFVSRDGRRVQVEGNASCRFEDGKPVATRAIFRDITESHQAEQERERLILELQEALAQVKALSGLLPMCAWCRKIRDDEGYWENVEGYVRRHSEVKFTHGMCPECSQKFAGGVLPPNPP